MEGMRIYELAKEVKLTAGAVSAIELVPNDEEDLLAVRYDVECLAQELTKAIKSVRAKRRRESKKVAK